MNRFYGLLVAVAVVAGVLIWKGTRPGSGGASTAEGPPVAFTAADSAFRGHMLGSDSAPVEIVEYADLQCPHCGEFAVVQFPTIREQLINTGRVRWWMRDFPLNFPWSRVSALAAQCAGEQGRYWEMVEAIHQAQGDRGRSNRLPGSRGRGTRAWWCGPSTGGRRNWWRRSGRCSPSREGPRRRWGMAG